MKAGAPFGLALCLALFASCGIDSYTWLSPVAESSVVRNLNSDVRFTAGDSVVASVVVELNFQAAAAPPSIRAISGDINNFNNNYYLFYKIYVSGLSESSPSETTYASINPTLGSDYTSLKPYTVTTNNYASSVASAFSSRKFFRVDSASNPYLLRSRDLITPYPNNIAYASSFYYSADLVNAAYLNANNNADVAANATGADTNLAYVALYVVRKSFDAQSLTEVFSVPTFLGVFLLPNNPNQR
ncbi:MAG: hypothetical protein LBS82_01060 [Spirochaetaceae bacterium]|nr:hypothetical protein [Spirochaetaceae bacterium]